MDWKDRLFHTINYTAFILFALICFYPFYYLFISTISRNDFVDLGKITFYPIGIHFQNYIDVFKLDRIGNAALVSLARTVLGSAITLLFSAYMAYIFTKNNLWGRKILYRITIATMYFSAGIIPKYLNIKMLGLMDSFWVYIIPGMISVYNMILIKTFIESLPPSLEESAQIDGAGYFTRFSELCFRYPLRSLQQSRCLPLLETGTHLWTQNYISTTTIYLRCNIYCMSI